MPGRAMAVKRSASVSLMPREPRGSRTHNIAAQEIPSSAMATKVPRQPHMVAINDPTGAPSATAKVVPPTTTAIARARCSGPASDTAVAWAVAA